MEYHQYQSHLMEKEKTHLFWWKLKVIISNLNKIHRN